MTTISLDEMSVYPSRLREATDRKSTRLNSSHQIISYAVFCLKKKNKDQCASPLRNPLRASCASARTQPRPQRLPEYATTRLWYRDSSPARGPPVHLTHSTQP